LLGSIVGRKQKGWKRLKPNEIGAVDGGANRTKLELILFFKDNPGTIDSAAGIAARLGRSLPLTLAALRELVRAGIICELPREGCTAYAYASSMRLLYRLDRILPDSDPAVRQQLLTVLLRR
jgi:hypothetical protein